MPQPPWHQPAPCTRPRVRRRGGVALVCALLVSALALGAPPAHATSVVRAPLDEGAFAALRGGRMLFVECQLPPGDAAQAFLQQYLAEPANWTRYRDRLRVAIPFADLNAATQRAALLAIFPEDYVNEAGWWHQVTYTGASGLESWWALSEWLTGKGTQYRAVMAVEENLGVDATLAAGDRILFPRGMLREALRAPTPNRTPPLQPSTPLPAPAEDAMAPAILSAEEDEAGLSFGEDAQGAYAVYRLKPGEALYSAVVVRFTDFREPEDVNAAAEQVARRNRIADVTDIDAGAAIKIPLDLLAARYMPRGTEQREEYEAVRRAQQQLEGQRVRSAGLAGVVVVLDPGHGGRDFGAAQEDHGLYEDEINYDIVCRVKRLLETETGARVHVTVRDRSQGYEPVDLRRFLHDTDEELLTTPPYPNTDARISANLRWYLANAIYRREVAAGTDPRQIVFASFHCDALFTKSLRGAMVYVPGAAYRRDKEQPMSQAYIGFAEAKEQLIARSTAASRRRDEALSRNFAETVLHHLRTNRPPLKVHDAGDPIRNVIRQSGGRAYVPAVLRNNDIPTKVLIESANLTNATDRQRLSDPKWRQWFAEAFVRALRAHYND